MQKKTSITVAALALLTGTAGYWLYSSKGPSSQALVQQKQQLSVNQDNHPSDTTATLVGSKEIAELHQVLDNFNNELARAIDDESLQDPEPLLIELWTPMDNPPSDGMLALPEAITDRTAINLDVDALDMVTIGDSVSFSLPGNYHYDAVIDKTTYNGNGDKTLVGYLADTQDQDSRTYPIIITLGDGSSFATIVSPYGNYSMETINGQGWIYKNPPRSTLEAAETDAIVPRATDERQH